MRPPDDLAALLQHNRWIRDLARSLVADSHQADDLVQDAWLAAVNRTPDVSWSLRGWLATVLRRRSVELKRMHARRRDREQRVARSETLPSAHEVVEKAALQRQVVEAVLDLDEPYRTTVLMRFFEESLPREIARRTGVPVATVQSRLARGLDLLREKLSREGGPESWLSVLLPLMKEPALAKATVLGIGAMKLTALVVLAASVILGVIFWRHAPANVDDAGRTSLAGQSRTVEREHGSRFEEPAPALDARTPAQTIAHGSGDAPLVAETAQVRTVRGRVLDTFGVGLSGVQLALAHKGEGRHASTPVVTTSGSGGWFEIAPTGEADSIVSADDRYATVLAGSARVQGDTQPTVVVAARVDLSGDVVDEDGAPLSGVAVELRLPEGFGAEWGFVPDYSRPQRWSVRSGDDGRFELSGVPAVLDATLAAALGGYVTRVELAPCHSDPHLEIVLARPRAEAHLIRGIVVDPDGRPVRGARVSARAEVAITNASGEFALDLDSPGTRPPLRALKRGYMPAEFEPEPAQSGWPAHVVLHLGGPCATIRGRVVDDEHKGVAGARVWLDDATSFGRVGRDLVAVENQLRGDDRFWGYVESGADGAFELPGVLPRDYRLKAVVPDTLVEGHLEHVVAGDAPVEIVLDTRNVHARVAGHVVGRDGRPIVGAAVRLLRITYQVDLDRGHQNDGIERRAVITDGEGAFELRAVPKTGVGLLVTGDTILFAGAELKEGSDLEHLRIVAAQRYHLQVELRQPVDRADHFRVLDEEGEPLVLHVMQDEGAFFGPEQPLVDGRSDVIALEDGATTLVLLRDGLEVERSRISLSAGETNVVRP